MLKNFKYLRNYSEIVKVSVFFSYFAVVKLIHNSQSKKFMTTNQALDRYLASLPNEVRIAKSRDIRNVLKISRAKLSDWRRGRTQLHPLFLREISEIVGVDLLADVEN